MAATRNYVYAVALDDPVLFVNGTTPYYPHANHLLSTAALTNAAGAVVERYAYSGYGSRTVMNAGGSTIPKSTVGFQRGFTGYRLDEETSLYYARWRMYDPALGRFISRDPLGYVDGSSLYAAYFAPNALDPWGLMSEACQGYWKAMIVAMGRVQAIVTPLQGGDRECLTESEEEQLAYYLKSQGDYAGHFAANGCWDEEMSELEREALLRDAQIILDATAKVTSYVPEAGQVV